jgi:hypothetical protein
MSPKGGRKAEELILQFSWLVFFVENKIVVLRRRAYF